MATVGDSSAPSTNTVYYDALLTTTLNAYRKTLFDNIFKDSAFLYYLRMTDAVRKQDGGERIAIPLMYESNSTVKTHGGYSVIDTTPQDGLTTALTKAQYKPLLIDLEVLARTTGGKQADAVQPERLSEEDRKVCDSLVSGITLN